MQFLRCTQFAGGSARATLFQEDASGVAQPDAVGGPAVEANVRGERVGAFEDAARASGRRGVADDQLDPLVLRQMADDLGINPGNRLKLSRPVAVEMRPGEPGGGVRLPLGGHAVAAGGGSDTNSVA